MPLACVPSIGLMSSKPTPPPIAVRQGCGRQTAGGVLGFAVVGLLIRRRRRARAA
jgi:hypothetical protein